MYKKLTLQFRIKRNNFFVLFCSAQLAFPISATLRNTCTNPFSSVANVEDLYTFFNGVGKSTPLNEQDWANFQTLFSEPPIANRGYGYYMNMLRRTDFLERTVADSLVVDVGCGLSNFTEYVAATKGSKSYGLDLIFHPEHLENTKRIQRDKTQKKFLFWQDPTLKDYPIEFDRRISGSLTNLPFPDNSVDTFVAMKTFLWLDGNVRDRALEELYRALKPGGKAYLETDSRVQPKFKKMGWTYRMSAEGIVEIKKPE